MNTDIKKVKRAFAPKTRSGCNTCKHLKCDEGKPSCSRCIKYGVTCWYNAPKAIQRPIGQYQLLAPRSSGAGICASPALNLFETSDEWLYFQRFCGYARRDLSPSRGLSCLWSRIVLQVAQAEPCIRHTATAIGALDFRCRPYSSQGAEMRTPFAYREYQKGIAGLRKVLSTQKCDLRVKLIACVLFACFESFHANIDAARKQIFAGLAMLDEYLVGRSVGQVPLEKDYLDYFAMLEIQAASWGDQRSPSYHREKQRVCAEIVEGIPAVFSTVLEASYMINTNMLRGMHFRESMSPDHVTGALFIVNKLPIRDTQPAQSELARVLISFQRWDRAFQPLFQRSRTTEGRPIYTETRQLRLQYLSSYLWMAAGSPHPSLYYRKYEKELREIVALGKEVLRENYVAGVAFALDQTVVLPLSIVGLVYRHRRLRDEVISSFEGMQRKDGIWDAGLLAAMMSWLRQIEEGEAGLGDVDKVTYVPKEMFARIMDMKVDAARRIVWVQCCKGSSEELFETELRCGRVE